MMRWVKIQPPDKLGWIWVVDADVLFIDDLLGRHYRKDQVSPIGDPMEADDPATLDWHGSLLDVHTAHPTNGWLSPEGKHYACAPQYHLPYARLMLQATEQNLGDRGWLKIFAPWECPAWIMYRGNEPTQAQINWLFDQGFEVP